MNKITLSILLMATISLAANSQVVLTYPSHAMNEGDVLILNRVSYVTAGEGGANQVWDFSKAETLDAYVINYDEDITLYSGRPKGKSFLCTENSARKPYFQVTPTQKLYYGVDGEYAQIRFDEPLVDMVYPFAYGDEISGDMNGTYNTTNNTTSIIKGKYYTKADAWGNIILPNGKKIENVLRVKTVRDYNQEIYNTQYHITVTRYAFFSPSSRYAVMQIQEVEYNCDNRRDYSDKAAYFNPDATNEPMPVYAQTTGLVNQKEITYSIYPNPVSNELTLDYFLAQDANVNISLSDLSGKKIKVIRNGQLKAGNHSLKENISEITSGVFILHIQVGDTVYTEKITKK